MRFLADDYYRNGYAGRRLYGLFVSHHLEEVRVEVSALPITRYPLARLIAMADRVEPAVIAAEVLTQQEIDELRQEWERADSVGTFFASICGMSTWGRKP